MSGYIDVPFDSDPDRLAADVFEFLQAAYPGWIPHDGNLEVVMIEAFSRLAAINRDLASRFPTSAFRYFGSKLVGLKPIDTAPATMQTNWTMIGTAGYTIPAGTNVGVRSSGGVIQAFRTINDTVVPVGAGTANGVTVVATVPGAASSDLGAPGAAVELITPLLFVTGVVQIAPSAGGVDAELDSAYLDRLAIELRLLTPRPIVPADFEVLAKRIPGNDRALAIDGYNPAAGTYNNERMIGLTSQDASGEAWSTVTKNDTVAYLESLRELNFVVNGFNPTYTIIDVTFTFVLTPGYNEADTEGRAIAAVAEYLDPKNWGLPDFGDKRLWENKGTVYKWEIGQAISNVEGVDHIATLTMRTGIGAFLEQNIVLAGAAPLPRPGTILGTVV